MEISTLHRGVFSWAPGIVWQGKAQTDSMACHLLSPLLSYPRVLRGDEPFPVSSSGSAQLWAVPLSFRSGLSVLHVSLRRRASHKHSA